MLKIVKGDLLGFSKIQFVEKSIKNIEGEPFGDIEKNYRIKNNENFQHSLSAEKCKRGHFGIY